MDNVEAQVQKHLVSFCKILPVHVGLWQVTLQESVNPLRVLSNLCEQRRHVKRANVRNFEDFEDSKSAVMCQISTRIEEELVILKKLIDKLSKCNNDLKNKLLTLERSTLNLEWEGNGELIRGNGSQPSLARLLQSGLSFLSFFSKNARNISECFKNLNLDNEKSIKDLQDSFDVDVDVEVVSSLIALTQYVDNEKAIL